MYNYHKIYTESEPLRLKLEISNKLVAEKTEALRIKKEELERVNKKN